MVRDRLPFSLRTAQMILSIAANPRLCDSSQGSRLPASWTTLYQLSRWSEDEIAIGLKHETFIRPDLTRAAVQDTEGGHTSAGSDGTSCIKVTAPDCPVSLGEVGVREGIGQRRAGPGGAGVAWGGCGGLNPV